MAALLPVMIAAGLIVFLALLVGVALLCRYTSPSSPLALRWLRAQVWFVSVGRWENWIVMSRWKGERWGRFRQHVPRKPNFRRWGGYVLALEIGDRGGTRAGVRHRMRMDPCPHAPFVGELGVACAECGAKAAMVANFGRPPSTASAVQARRDGRIVGVGRGWHLPDYEGGEMRAASEAPLDTKPICKMRINGGNGNPANAHRECACRGPRDCKLGGRGVGQAGPEQDETTDRFVRPERA